MIVDPWGEILAEQAEGEGVIAAEMDLERLREVQSSLPAHANRRMH
jgi:nitrilase